MDKMQKSKAQVPQHREKGGRELGQEARNASFMNAIGPSCGPILGPGLSPPVPPSQLAAAIKAVKG